MIKLSFQMAGMMLSSALLAQKQTKTNILVFIADDAGMDYGCYGNPYIKTPNIDALAANGMIMENAFLTSPQSSPSRTSMLSGQFAHTIRTEDLHMGVNDTTRLVPSYLREAGYFSGLMLKSHLGSKGDKQFDWLDNGFGEWLRGEWNDRALNHFQEFLQKKGDKPFFLWCAFVDPHRPYTEDPIVANRAPEVHDPSKVIVPAHLVDGPKTRIDIAHYYDEIYRMDQHIGRMMAELKKQGLLENTLILFLTDNGMPFVGCKGSLYDKGIHTPLIFSWKGVIKPGTRYKGLASTIDLAPTFLDVAGIKKPASMYGESIKTIFSDVTLPGRKYIFSERNWHDCDEHIRCIRNDHYKMIVNAYIEVPFGVPGDLARSLSGYELREWKNAGKLNAGQLRIFQCPRPHIEIYDLQKDPNELLNIAEGQEIIEPTADMLKELKAWMKKTNDFSPHMYRKDDESDRVTGYPFSGLMMKDYWND